MDKKYYIKYKNINDLKVGSIIDENVYSSSGDLLFPKSHKLTLDNLGLLKSRIEQFIFVLRDKPEKKIEKEFINYGNDINPEVDKKVTNREISNIPFGKSGLKVLLESDFVKYLNKLQLRDNKNYHPTSFKFRDSLNDLLPEKRDKEYKDWVNNSYEINLGSYRQILKSIATGETRNSDRILLLVKFFMSIFKNDKSMLVNLASSNSYDGEYIFKHSYNVCLIVMGFAAHLGYDEKKVEELSMAALLHDVGMLFVSDEIRSKKEMLNNREWYEIKKHPLVSVEICRKLNHLPKSSLFVMLQIHEKMNGFGYPQELSNLMIHPYTKIVQVVDIYDSLISERPYRKAYSPFEAIEILLKLAENRSLEKKIVVNFIQYISIFPIGTLVKLSDNRIGKVIALNNNDLKRPKLSIVIDSTGHRIETKKAYKFDLSKNRGVNIKQSISVSLFNDINIMDGF